MTSAGPPVHSPVVADVAIQSAATPAICGEAMLVPDVVV